jgi:hypothetical protein
MHKNGFVLFLKSMTSARVTAVERPNDMGTMASSCVVESVCTYNVQIMS